MTSAQAIVLAIAGGLILVAVWNLLQSQRINRLQKRLKALEKKSS